MPIFNLLFGLFIVFMVFMFVRNHRVYNYKMKLIDRISTTNMKEIHEGKESKREARWEYFSSVGYEEMIFKFWIWDLDSFYDLKKFEFSEENVTNDTVTNTV